MIALIMAPGTVWLVCVFTIVVKRGILDSKMHPLQVGGRHFCDNPRMLHKRSSIHVSSVKLFKHFGGMYQPCIIGLLLRIVIEHCIQS